MEWKEVLGGRYRVSSEGQVEGVRWRRLRKLVLGRRGYLYVTTPTPGGGWKAFKVHLLVAEAFLGPRPTGFQVNHKNGDKLDNQVENLEYVTPKQNVRHAYSLGHHRWRAKWEAEGRL